MRQSLLFSKSRHNFPRDEVANNAKMLIRAGFVNKELAGIYSYLPLGLLVLNRISDLVRREMNNLGAQEILMPTIQNPQIWKETGRWDNLDVWFKSKINAGGDIGLGWTHEENVINIMKNNISSYRDLPVAIFQIQNKFRNEERAKSGLMRGREFLMKDLYSFHLNEEDLDDYYEKVAHSYRLIFDKLGLGDITYQTVASGGLFAKWSHEFQTLCPSGEDQIYISEKRRLAINSEVYNQNTLTEFGLKAEELLSRSSCEVGNIFKLKTRFSEPLGLYYSDQGGENKVVQMGCFGIGISRLLGVIAEVFSDEKGLSWPEVVAPFLVHLLILGEDKEMTFLAEGFYQKAQKAGISVLLDDRKESAGQKLSTADLLGMPYRAIVSKNTAGRISLKSRKSDKEEIFSVDSLINYLSDIKSKLC
ncbi:MAG TPA: prolyl-tRNA synthetase [Candidatus Vogelbacteria bacterium]|nr:prolyl-tRNA synthetase [Candidatus Vogelbacteria bacterium]